jgi:hypothetical protein
VRYHLDCGCCLRYPGQSAVGRRYADVYQPPAGHLSFLKDPVLVNAIFLKKPERIEALGLILVLSLLLWRLIELSMRQYLEQNQTELPGWDNKPTTRPTTFMMTTKFQGIQVLKLGQRRWLARKLSEVYKLYPAKAGIQLFLLDSRHKHVGMTPEDNGHFILWSCTKGRKSSD